MNEVVQDVELSKEKVEVKSVKNLRRKSSALSLKSIHHKLKDLDHIQEEEDLSKKPKDTFKEEELVGKWQSFAEKLHKGGERSMASILNASKPTVKDFKVVYQLPNQLMADQFKTIRPSLLKHLRISLNNYALDIEVIIKVSEEKKYIYTPQEKFQQLLKTNPDIQFLKDMFNLDF